MELPERITHFRERADMTKVQLAAAVGVSDVAVVQWESGKTSPQSTRLPAIAEALGVTLKVFFGDIPRRRAKRAAR
jgi:transcriptional regulator with XRE-family HTH domain